jgi:hypothetical protein
VLEVQKDDAAIECDTVLDGKNKFFGVSDHQCEFFGFVCDFLHGASVESKTNNGRFFELLQDQLDRFSVYLIS